MPSGVKTGIRQTELVEVQTTRTACGRYKAEFCPFMQRNRHRPPQNSILAGLGMGNCQAVDAAFLVIQHSDGKLEKIYWSVSANEVMRKNPDHYVTLIMPVPESNEEPKAERQEIKSTHVKLLRSTDILHLGSAYRLVRSKEVLNVLRAKKSARMSKRQVSPALISENGTDKQGSSLFEGVAEKTTTEDIFKATGKWSRPLTKKPAMRRSKLWHPSLKTIAEIPSQ